MSAFKPPKAFDVWYVTANTVYKAVPYNVVADWTQQGRLNANDKVRPSGTESAWKPISEWDFLADYLPRAVVTPVAAAPGVAAGEPIHLREAPEEETLIAGRKAGESDDDVDMIPLIDISMVLLVFFIMVSAAGALSPVDVPDMSYAGELHADSEAITISIERVPNDDEKVHYSIRTGQTPAKKEDSALPNPEETIVALERMLGNRVRPPEVRIACEKDLPSDRVYEIAKQLKKLKDSNKINSFVATVNEAPKK